MSEIVISAIELAEKTPFLETVKYHIQSREMFNDICQFINERGITSFGYCTLLDIGIFFYQNNVSIDFHHKEAQQK